MEMQSVLNKDFVAKMISVIKVSKKERNRQLVEHDDSYQHRKNAALRLTFINLFEQKPLAESHMSRCHRGTQLKKKTQDFSSCLC